jgi:hypothetical protein
MFKLGDLEPMNFIIEGARFFNLRDKQIILRRKDALNVAIMVFCGGKSAVIPSSLPESVQR